MVAMYLVCVCVSVCLSVHFFTRAIPATSWLMGNINNGNFRDTAAVSKTTNMLMSSGAYLDYCLPIKTHCGDLNAIVLLAVDPALPLMIQLVCIGVRTRTTGRYSYNTA